jgi:hypothetical protein
VTLCIDASTTKDIVMREPEKYFTVVFEGDLRNIDSNPFKLDSIWGKPVSIALGDAMQTPDEPLVDQNDLPTAVDVRGILNQ